MTGPAANPIPVGDYPGFDVIVRSRVSLERNVDDAPFPHSLRKVEAATLAIRLAQAVKAAGFEVSRAGELEPRFRANLVQRELYSRPYMLDDDNVAALCPDRGLWIAVNDSNHLSIRASRPGLELQAGWNDAVDAERAVSLALGEGSWAFDSELGYLMSEAAFCGSGLSASVTLHAPALVISGLAEAAFKRAMEAGFIVAGSYSGITASAGSLFDIALPKEWRDPETSALGRLESAARTLAEYERRAREMLLTGSWWEILDVIGRAAGSAAGARLVSRDEAAEIASGLRLGIACGILEGIGLESATELWVSLGAQSTGEEKQDEPDAARRARAMRHACDGLHFIERYRNV
jgi:protein arginine kinase